jgi:hypothetical protein
MIRHSLSRSKPRPAFTVLETVVALGVLTMIMMFVAQMGAWTITERARTAARHDAVEAAANVLESARALPWESLTSQWAQNQQLPESLSKRLAAGKVIVQLTQESGCPTIKRVRVTIDWQQESGLPAQPVELVAFISARSSNPGKRP